MAPIHDTDLAADRWAKAEWEQYELWEKIELKLRRRKWLLIGATVLVFLGLSSIPIVVDHAPKWTAISLSRRLADQIAALKRDAALSHRAFRIRFAGDDSTSYVIESAASCAAGGASDKTSPTWSSRRTGDLVTGSWGSWGSGGGSRDFAVLSTAEGRQLGVPGLVESLCYDPQTGSDIEGRGDPLAGFGVISAADLAGHRIDRISLMLVHGPSAELSFE